MRTSHYESLISSYVNDTLKVKDRAKVEELIGSDEAFNHIYQQKLLQKDFYSQLIPDYTLSRNDMSAIKQEMSRINEDVFPKEKYHLVKKVYKYLTEPVIEI